MRRTFARIVRRCFTAFAAILLLLPATACERSAGAPYVIEFGFVGDASLPSATLDSVAQAMAAVWQLRMATPYRAFVQVQQEPLMREMPGAVPALFIPCEGRGCRERFVLSLEGARTLQQVAGIVDSEAGWLAYLMAHEAVHLWQLRRGDRLEPSTRDPDAYAARVSEREAFREAALVAGARQMLHTGSDEDTQTLCPRGMAPRYCRYLPGEFNPYVSVLPDVRYRVVLR
jgi:hypothetical protein